MVSRAGREAKEGAAGAASHTKPEQGIHDDLDRKRPCRFDVAKLRTAERERHYREVFRDIDRRRRKSPSRHEFRGIGRAAVNGERENVLSDREAQAARTGSPRTASRRTHKLRSRRPS